MDCSTCLSVSIWRRRRNQKYCLLGMVVNLFYVLSLSTRRLCKFNSVIRMGEPSTTVCKPMARYSLRSGPIIRPVMDNEHSKLVKDIHEALVKCHAHSGMTISFHHHFREGDLIVNMVMEEIHKMGIKNITLAQPSHPLLSPSPPALNPSQHQSLFQ